MRLQLLVMLAAAIGCAVVLWPAMALAASAFALPVLARGATTEPLLAQRSIDRSWGVPDDSIYVEIDVPEWRSEGVAAGLSFALPGAGQLYVGDKKRALVFALIEAVGWGTRIYFDRRSAEFRDEAATFAGAPTDSASAWSSARWAAATGSDPSDLERLYAADRDGFYNVVTSDPRFAAGWNAESSRQHVDDLIEVSDQRMSNVHYASVGLWINHLVASFDALRSARIHNAGLAPKFGLKVRSGWRHGAPTFSAALMRSF